MPRKPSASASPSHAARLAARARAPGNNIGSADGGRASPAPEAVGTAGETAAPQDPASTSPSAAPVPSLSPAGNAAPAVAPAAAAAAAAAAAEVPCPGALEGGPLTHSTLSLRGGSPWEGGASTRPSTRSTAVDSSVRHSPEPGIASGGALSGQDTPPWHATGVARGKQGVRGGTGGGMGGSGVRLAPGGSRGTLFALAALDRAPSPQGQGWSSVVGAGGRAAQEVEAAAHRDALPVCATVASAPPKLLCAHTSPQPSISVIDTEAGAHGTHGLGRIGGERLWPGGEGEGLRASMGCSPLPEVKEGREGVAGGDMGAGGGGSSISSWQRTRRLSMSSVQSRRQESGLLGAARRLTSVRASLLEEEEEEEEEPAGWRACEVGCSRGVWGGRKVEKGCAWSSRAPLP